MADSSKPQRYALVGMKHRGAEAFVASLPPDEPLTLVREPSNRFDANAIQVWARGKHVGYISKDQNATLARFIDANGKPWVKAKAAAMPPESLVAADQAMDKMTDARLHKGSNTWPLVEIA